MIDERLVGTWWAFKRNGNPYCIFKGPSACSPSGSLPDSTCSCWYSPFNDELQKVLGGPQIIFLYRSPMARMGPVERVSTQGITFPPEEYIDDESITEIEIKPNGDYVIFDSIKI